MVHDVDQKGRGLKQMVAVPELGHHCGSHVIDQKHEHHAAGQALQGVHPVARVRIFEDVVFRDGGYIKTHDGMKQQGNVDDENFYPDQERQIVEGINAQLVREHADGAQGVERKMQGQEDADRDEASQGMELQKEVLDLAFGDFSH